jgi:copper chaperone CopZ
MRKKFKISGVDCANCAAKMERAIGKIEGVDEVALSFMTQKLIVKMDEAQEDAIVNSMTKACKKIDRHVKIESIR